MKFTVTDKYMLAKAENKGSVTLYTLLDLGNFNKLTTVGNHPEKEIPERSTVEATIDVTTKNERFKLEGGEIKFVETANLFISQVVPADESTTE